GRRHLAPFLAVLGRENLEIPKKLKPHFEHIHVVVVVFDIKHFDHDAALLSLRTAGLLGHLALISPEQVITAKSRSRKLELGPTSNSSGELERVRPVRPNNHEPASLPRHPRDAYRMKS